MNTKKSYCQEIVRTCTIIDLSASANENLKQKMCHLMCPDDNKRIVLIVSRLLHWMTTCRLVQIVIHKGMSTIL
jgi:hypothetical protein